MSESGIREASREIIHNLLFGEVDNTEKLKAKMCAKYRLSRIPSNAEVLAEAEDFERVKIVDKLRIKPVRSLSGINVVAVMSEPHQCPHGRCAYCPCIEGVPNSYTGREPSTMRGIQNEFEPYRQVKSRLEQLRRTGHSVGKVELIIQGGTFPATPTVYQRSFIKDCLDALSGERSRSLKEAKRRAEATGVRNVGITVETRPDYAQEEQVDLMLDMGVTRVEVGVQNVYDDLYRLVDRGHTVSDVIDGTRFLKDSGLKVCYHMMPGLPGSDPARDLEGFHTILENEAFRPDMLKIYPCLVLEGSKIHNWWQEGAYRAYTTEEAIRLIAEVKKLIPPWIRIMRIQRDIPAQLILDGVKKSNLRQLVQKRLREQGTRCRCIRCREVGHRAMRANDELDVRKAELRVRRYRASGGLEIFISFEDRVQDALIGFLRLRIPSEIAHRPEIGREGASLVRELHVYGTLTPVGERLKSSWQHKGYGRSLLKEAERISLEEFDARKLLVTSALGSRNYFRRHGYRLQGPYMSKILN